MKRIASAAIGLSCLMGLNAAAQVPERALTETTSKQTGPGTTVRTKSETVTGIVKEYDMGKKIRISGPNDRSYSFDLDQSVRVDGTIVVGQMAKVTYTRSGDGSEHVNLLSEASRKAQMDASAAKVHSESTVKESGPEGKTKTKTEVVIGILKQYEHGKKLTVSGPKSKDYSFDLDDHAVFKGSIAVGERVKVTYTKTDSGQRVTTVEPYHKA